MGDKIDKTLLDVGHVINEQWKILSVLGEGNCSRVYKVWDLKRKIKAALKTETDQLDILKKEYDVFKKLEVRRHVPRVLHAGRRDTYSYIVVTLCGKNLIDLKKDSGLDVFSASTMARVGIHVLYGIKQVHEIGYVHRDIKPANWVIGRGRLENRIVYVIDYGMARRYATWENGKPRHRQPREGCLFRGSYRYCSPFCHERKEQARRDDMYSYIYSLIFLHKSALPWNGMKPDEIAALKKSIKDEELLDKCPQEWLKIMQSIRTLEYQQRPDYRFIYDQHRATMERLKITFASAYDWERVVRSNRTQSCSGAASVEGNDSQKENKAPLEPVNPVKTNSTAGSEVAVNAATSPAAAAPKANSKRSAPSPQRKTSSIPKSPKSSTPAKSPSSRSKNIDSKDGPKGSKENREIVKNKKPEETKNGKKMEENKKEAAKKPTSNEAVKKPPSTKEKISRKSRRKRVTGTVPEGEKTDRTETFEEALVRNVEYPTTDPALFSSNDIGI